LLSTATLSLLALTACTTGDETEPATTTTSSGTGGGGGQATGGGGGQATGGSGGSGGAETPVVCLDADAHDAVFMIEDASLCVVAMYTAPIEVGQDANFYTAAPSWGRHGGPLIVKPGPMGNPDQVTLTRLTPPAMSGAAMTAATTEVDLNAGGTFFLGSEAIDLPASSWTLLSWTGMAAVGEVVAVDDKTVAKKYPNVGFYAAATVAGQSKQRLVHTGLTKLNDGDDKGGATGLYAADFCSGPALCDDPGPQSIHAWGKATGALAADGDGNVFAINTDPAFLGGDDTQTLLAFPATSIAAGSGPAAGVEMFTMPGFGSALAAMAPKAGSHGYIFFQPHDPMSYAALNVVAMRYSSDGTAMAPESAAADAITMIAQPTQAMLMNDDQGRLWMSINSDTNESTFYLIDRKPTG